MISLNHFLSSMKKEWNSLGESYYLSTDIGCVYMHFLLLSLFQLNKINFLNVNDQFFQRIKQDSLCVLVKKQKNSQKCILMTWVNFSAKKITELNQVHIIAGTNVLIDE